MATIEGQHAAVEEFPEFVDDEARETTAVRVHGGEELGEVHAHDAIEYAGRRRSGRVGGRHAVDR